MRGKEQFHSHSPPFTGITPAYAGKSDGAYIISDFLRGSPPPMRGKGSSVILDCVISGITPAYAGKRSAAYCFGVRVEDHPRLCGEKLVRHDVNPPEHGSPPPMRGKEKQSQKIYYYHRITPAYAGKRIMKRGTKMSIKDHPRLCGEKFKIAFVIFARSGSPPPMRGKETKKHIEFHVNRITPAYAGKSALHSSSGSGGLDHPRLCGEKLLGDCEPAADRGSPPPMRGKEDGMKIRVDLDGITPAYAGKSICLFCICIQI